MIGKAAIRPLAAQSAIRITAVRRPFAVHKGDRVTIEARQGNLSIQTVGVTKSHGEMGQTITVSNVDSGKELRATVVAPGVVRVTFLILRFRATGSSDADPASCCSVCSLPAPPRRAQKQKVEMAKLPPPKTTGSLWQEENGRAYLYEDLRAMRIGDIITI